MDSARTDYHLAPQGWTPERRNPFTENGSYGDAWSCLVVRDDDRRTWYGAVRGGPFTFHIWSDLPDVRQRVADFVRYENVNGRTPIIAVPLRLGGSEFIDAALFDVPESGRVRESDPIWIVNSTTEQSWRLIEAEGNLRSFSELDAGFQKVCGLGLRDLGEPPEFAEYVALAPMDSLAPEIVVSSLQKGRICDDPGAPYDPGIRLYFDCHSIIKSGLGVRDGRHFLKIHRRLPLPPFLAGAFGASDVLLPEYEASWTPMSFTRAANRAFLRTRDCRMSDSLEDED